MPYPFLLRVSERLPAVCHELETVRLGLSPKRFFVVVHQRYSLPFRQTMSLRSPRVVR
jgi:hypothetical protein